MAKKKKLFSGRGYNPRGSQKRAEKKLLRGIFNTDDIEKLSLEDRRDLKAYLKKKQKSIKESDNFSGRIAKDKGLLEPIEFDDASTLLQIFDDQEYYFEQLKYDEDIESREEFKGVEQDDKWTILRRLATEDMMLNIDRAYASETLHKIENLIEENKGRMTYQELADALLEGKFDEYQFDRNNPEKGLVPFKGSVMDIESQALSRNRGFHGVDKAMAKWHKETGTSSIASFSPAWQDIDLGEIDWNQFDEE